MKVSFTSDELQKLYDLCVLMDKQEKHNTDIYMNFYCSIMDEGLGEGDTPGSEYWEDPSVYNCHPPRVLLEPLINMPLYVFETKKFHDREYLSPSCRSVIARWRLSIGK